MGCGKSKASAPEAPAAPAPATVTSSQAGLEASNSSSSKSEVSKAPAQGPEVSKAPPPQFSGTEDASTADTSNPAEAAEVPASDQPGQATPAPLPETVSPEAEQAGTEATVERKSSRSSKRVSFHEAAPDVIVNSEKLEQRISQMQPVFSIGDKVEVCDKGDQNWKIGVVTHLTPLQVRPDGKKTSFEWTHVRHYMEPSNEEENSDEEKSPANEEAQQASNETREASSRKQRERACC